MEVEATDVMITGGKELLDLARAVPWASEVGLTRLSLRFTTLVSAQPHLCGPVPLAPSPGDAHTSHKHCRARRCAASSAASARCMVGKTCGRAGNGYGGARS